MIPTCIESPSRTQIWYTSLGKTNLRWWQSHHGKLMERRSFRKNCVMSGNCYELYVYLRMSKYMYDCKPHIKYYIHDIWHIHIPIHMHIHIHIRLHLHLHLHLHVHVHTCVYVFMYQTLFQNTSLSAISKFWGTLIFGNTHIVMMPTIDMFSSQPLRTPNLGFSERSSSKYPRLGRNSCIGRNTGWKYFHRYDRWRG